MNQAHNNFASQLAILTFDAALTEGANFARLQLLPAGEFAGSDGRPGTMPKVAAKAWVMDAAIAADLQAQSAARANDYVIDYEHQTLLSDKNGKPAPAAGWFKALQYDAAKGLFAVDVRWTDKAKAMIAAGEYKYISPVFYFNPETGRVTQLVNAGLTNNPNLDGMDEVRLAALKLNAALTQDLNPDANQDANPDATQDLNNTKPKQEIKPMKQLMAALKLNQEATEADALVALKTVQDDNIKLNTELVALRANQFDAAKHIPLTEHSKVTVELAALKATSDQTEHDRLMAEAITKHLIPAVNEAYWQGQPLAALKEFLKDAKPVFTPPAGSQTGGKAPEGAANSAQLNTDELAMAKAFGQTPEQFAKAKLAV